MKQVFQILNGFCRAAAEENPYLRIKQIVQWYLSGFYKKPKVNIFVNETIVIFLVLYHNVSLVGSTFLC